MRSALNIIPEYAGTHGGSIMLSMGEKRKMLLLLLKIAAGLVLLAVLFVAGMIGYVYLQKRQFARLADTHDLKQRISRLADAYVGKRKSAGLVIGVIQRGERHTKGFGHVSEANTSPSDAATLFEIGSVTKVFTAVTLARMALDGKLKLDDAITDYLPKDVTNRELRQITLTHLATHTSGLPRMPENFDEVSKDENNPYLNYKAEHLYQHLNSVKLKKPPGPDSGYSNLGFALLGHILELRAGKSYEALVKDALCVPLEMGHTTIRLSDEQKKSLSPGHDRKGRVVPNWDFDVMAPAGAFRSNVEDMLKFVAANLRPDASGLGKALEESHKTRIRGWGGKRGLAWHKLETMEGLKIVWHNGGTGGYVSFIGFDKDHQTGVIILSNYGDAMAGDDSVDKMALEILKLASKISLN